MEFLVRIHGKILCGIAGKIPRGNPGGIPSGIHERIVGSIPFVIYITSLNLLEEIPSKHFCCIRVETTTLKQILAEETVVQLLLFLGFLCNIWWNFIVAF